MHKLFRNYNIRLKEGQNLYESLRRNMEAGEICSTYRLFSLQLEPKLSLIYIYLSEYTLQILVFPISLAGDFMEN
jgi:hypothetical protein